MNARTQKRASVLTSHAGLTDMMRLSKICGRGDRSEIFIRFGKRDTSCDLSVRRALFAMRFCCLLSQKMFFSLNFVFKSV